MNCDPYLTPYTKKNSNASDQNVKVKIIKLLEENTEENLLNLELGKEYLNTNTTSTINKRTNW